MLKGLRPGLIVILLVAIIVISFGFGYGLGLRNCISEPALASIEQAWNIILSDYVEKDKIDVDTLSQAAIEGMVAALDDPYTTYLDKDAYRLNAEALGGTFEGIGAEVTIREGQLMVIAPLAGSPAAEAGIQPGDAILEIDGVSTSGMALYDAILKVRGPKGTSVSLLILHPGETEPVEIAIVRDEIEIASVSFEMRGDIAYIDIAEFNERTNEELTPVLEALVTQDAAGIIIDLRSNPGGIVKAVADVASHFLDEGQVILSIRDNEGNLEVIKANSQQITTDLPLVVLVDDFSASGSEVLAGAFQDHNRATIAGKKTFGKGSANYMVQLEDGSGLYITYARWLTPDGRMIEGEGITPDVELELSGGDVIQWAIDYLHGDS